MSFMLYELPARISGKLGHCLWYLMNVLQCCRCAVVVVSSEHGHPCIMKMMNNNWIQSSWSELSFNSCIFREFLLSHFFPSVLCTCAELRTHTKKTITSTCIRDVYRRKIKKNLAPNCMCAAQKPNVVASGIATTFYLVHSEMFALSFRVLAVQRSARAGCVYSVAGWLAGCSKGSNVQQQQHFFFSQQCAVCELCVNEGAVF